MNGKGRRGQTEGDGTIKTFARHLDEETRRLVDVTHGIRGVDVAVKAIEKGADVDVDNVPFFELSAVGNAVTDDLIDRSAETSEKGRKRLSPSILCLSRSKRRR